MMLRILPALIGADVSAEDRVVKPDIKCPSQANELVVPDGPRRIGPDIDRMTTRDPAAQLMFGPHDDVARQVDDTRPQDDDAVGVGDRRMGKAEWLRKRQYGAVDGGDFQWSFTSGHGTG